MARGHRTLDSGPLRHRPLDFSAIRMPARRVAPLEAIGRRLVIAISLLTLMAVIVVIQRNGYQDSADGHVSVLDAFYYSAVSATTTGFGDISPVSDSARLFDLILVTPARVMFLVVLVGTTLEALTDQSRRAFAARHWRKRVKNHYVVCGYGSTGRSSVRALRAQGVPANEIMVIERDPKIAELASDEGYVVIVGDAAQTGVLEAANVPEARSIIVAPSRDDTAVLVTLTAREMNPEATIVSGVREAENLHLLKQSGATSVIHSAEAVGRLLGMATQSASAARVMDDLLLPGSGLDVIECDPVVGADGIWSAPTGSSLLAIVRGEERRQLPGDSKIREGDRLVVLQPTGGGN